MSRFVEWWKNNPEKAEEIRRRRRERYRQYRDRELERKRVSRVADRQRLPKPKTVTVDDLQVELWSVGRTSKFLGIHKRTLAGLEARRAIPINRITDSRGRRWWPADFVKWLKPYFDLKNSKKITAREFRSRVSNDWKLAIVQFPVIGEDDVRG